MGERDPLADRLADLRVPDRCGGREPRAGTRRQRDRSPHLVPGDDDRGRSWILLRRGAAEPRDVGVGVRQRELRRERVLRRDEALRDDVGEHDDRPALRGNRRNVTDAVTGQPIAGVSVIAAWFTGTSFGTTNATGIAIV